MAVSPALAATEHYGQVGFTGLAVPGATVTATQGDKQIVTTTDQTGLYRFPDLAEGTWSIKIEKRGFEPLTRDVTVAPGSQAAVWELALQPFEEITKGMPPPVSQVDPAPSGSAPAPSGAQRAAQPAAPAAQTGFQRAGVTAPARPPAAAAAARPAAPEEPPADSNQANDGFLINGSVNNGAASPFAQFAAFGNNRRRPGALYNTQLGMTLNTSAWDASPASLTGQ